MKIWFFIIFCSMSSLMYSQNTYYVIEDARYRNVADNIIRSVIGRDFDKAIKFVVAWEYGGGQDNEYPNYRKGVRVYYNFVNAYNQKFDLKKNFTYGSSRISTGYSIYLDASLKLIEPVDKNLLKKIYSYYDTKLITEREAERIALKNSKIETRSTSKNRLFYHVDNDKFVWRIIRERVTTNVDVEEFEIDAIKGRLLNYRKFSYVDGKSNR